MYATEESLLKVRFSILMSSFEEGEGREIY